MPHLRAFFLTKKGGSVSEGREDQEREIDLDELYDLLLVEFHKIMQNQRDKKSS